MAAPLASRAALRQNGPMKLSWNEIRARAAAGAAHIAIAVTNGVDYLVTWNFRHIANVAMRTAIERICRQAGYEPPVICTRTNSWDRRCQRRGLTP